MMIYYNIINIKFLVILSKNYILAFFVSALATQKYLLQIGSENCFIIRLKFLNTAK